mmetsp:Transcript_24161/g.27867  ORF Transcript_24161/g.27867 Transcript_24161/m.27867 type:complete len:96 (+) Transcript_24161:2-289(+)
MHACTSMYHCIATPYEKLPLCSVLAYEEDTAEDQEDESITLMAKRISKKTSKVVTLSKGFQFDKSKMEEFYLRVEKFITETIRSSDADQSEPAAV